MTGLAPRRVAPFGHLGITACVPLPRASRSLPRPSSPPCAQASPTCLPSLDYKIVKQNYARLPSQSTSTNPHPAFEPTRRPACTMSTVKIPFPTNQSSTKRPRPMTHPLVLHFSNSDRDQTTLAVSLAL